MSPQEFAETWEKISDLLDSRAKSALRKAHRHKGLNDRLGNIYIARSREFYAFEQAILACGRIVQENSVLKQILAQMHGQLHELETKQAAYEVPKEERN